MKTALDILLRSGEGQFIEYKSIYDRPKGKSPRKRKLKDIAKDVAICLAEFANADSGTLLLGVENDGTVTGAPLDRNEAEAVHTMAADSWKQPVLYTWEAASHSNVPILVFEVDLAADVFTLTDGRTPYRNNDKTMWLSVEEVRALKRTKASTLIERSIVPFASFKDLDEQLLQRFRESIGAPPSISDQEALKDYDLVITNGRAVVLTLAACLLFGKPPMVRFHERCGINFRKFEGTEALTGARSNEVRDETIEEPLPILIERTFDLLRNQTKISIKLRDLFFEERPEYPTFAWQEAIVNAVAHRNYSFRGSGIEIKMFDDRLEIKSPGLPPEPVTVAELQERKPVHASRNPRIMRVLKVFKYVRERGEGLPRMFEEMEDSSLPLPELKTEGQFFTVTLRNTVVFNDETMRWLRGFPLDKISTRQRRILAHTHQSGKGYFVLRDYASINHIDKEKAKKEIRELVDDLGIVEVVGYRKAAKYYPLMQRGTMEEKLREYF